MAIVCEGGKVTQFTKSRKAPRSAAKPTAEKARTLAIVKGDAPERKASSKACKPNTPKPAVVETPAPAAAPDTPVPAPEASAPVPASPAKSKRKARSIAAEAASAAEHAQSLAGLAQAFEGKLRGDGKTESTVNAYRGELNLALAHFGAETRVKDLTKEAVLEYFHSKPVTKLRSGRAKSPLSIAKTQRVLRQCLEWAHAQGWIKESIVPDLPAAS